MRTIVKFRMTNGYYIHEPFDGMEEFSTAIETIFNIKVEKVKYDNGYHDYIFPELEINNTADFWSRVGRLIYDFRENYGFVIQADYRDDSPYSDLVITIEFYNGYRE